MKPVSIWRVWSLAWLVSITAAEGSRIRAAALYSWYWSLLAVVWSRSGLYSLRNDIMVSVASPKEKVGTTARFGAILMLPLLSLVILSVLVASFSKVSSFAMILIYFAIILILLAPGIFHMIGSKAFASDIKIQHAMRSWMKCHKVKPYYLPHIVARQDVLTPEAIEFFLKVYRETVPSGAPVVVLAENEKLAALCRSELGLSPLSNKDRPTTAFAGFKQEQGAASV